MSQNLSQNEINICKNIENDIDSLEKNLISEKDQFLRTKILNDVHIKKKEVEQMYVSKAYGAQIRARAKWVEEGEKNTNFFLSLENKRQTGNRITKKEMPMEKSYMAHRKFLIKLINFIVNSMKIN